MASEKILAKKQEVIDEIKSRVQDSATVVIFTYTGLTDEDAKKLRNELYEKYNVPVLGINVLEMSEADIVNVLKEALYEFPIDHIEFNIPDWVGVLDITHPLKQKFLSKMKECTTNIDKLRDVENINVNITDDDITNSYISSLDTDNSEVTITMDANNDLYDQILNDLVGSSINSKGDLLKVFQDLNTGRGEYDSIKGALKQVYQTGYGIVLPQTKD